MGAKYVIEVNTKPYIPWLLAVGIRCRQQDLRPRRRMLHDWPCQVGEGGVTSWNRGFGSPAYCSGMSFPSGEEFGWEIVRNLLAIRWRVAGNYMFRPVLLAIVRLYILE